jgi:hypothetical protein
MGLDASHVAKQLLIESFLRRSRVPAGTVGSGRKIRGEPHNRVVGGFQLVPLVRKPLRSSHMKPYAVTLMLQSPVGFKEQSTSSPPVLL